MVLDTKVQDDKRRFKTSSLFWRKTNGKSHLIISEDIKDNKHINKNSIIKDIYNNKGKIINKKRLLSVVACNKAIPIPTKVAGVFERLIINGNKNESLLRKELLECRRKTNTIINKSTKIIKDQKENGTQIFESKYFLYLIFIK